MGKQQQQAKKQSSKQGRNKVKCERYRVTRELANRIRKLAKHLRYRPNDELAERELGRLCAGQSAAMRKLGAYTVRAKRAKRCPKREEAAA
jgi:ribosomal protein S15P/S13E